MLCGCGADVPPQNRFCGSCGQSTEVLTLKSEIESLRHHLRHRTEEVNQLKQRIATMQNTYELEEDAIALNLMKQLEAARKEQALLRAQLKQEESGNKTRQEALDYLKKQKKGLEAMLHEEHEYIINKLMQQLEQVNTEKKEAEQLLQKEREDYMSLVSGHLSSDQLVETKYIAQLKKEVNRLCTMQAESEDKAKDISNKLAAVQKELFLEKFKNARTKEELDRAVSDHNEFVATQEVLHEWLIDKEIMSTAHSSFDPTTPPTSGAGKRLHHRRCPYCVAQSRRRSPSSASISSADSELGVLPSRRLAHGKPMCLGVLHGGPTNESSFKQQETSARRLSRGEDSVTTTPTPGRPSSAQQVSLPAPETPPRAALI